MVVESLPPTLFCFSGPALRMLREGGDALYRGMPYQFLPYVVALVSHTFCNDQISFDAFLECFKQGCFQLYDILVQSDFQSLLQALIEESKVMNPAFFGDLSQHVKILDIAFGLLRDKKVSRFDSSTIK